MTQYMMLAPFKIIAYLTLTVLLVTAQKKCRERNGQMYFYSFYVYDYNPCPSESNGCAGIGKRSSQNCYSCCFTYDIKTTLVTERCKYFPHSNYKRSALS